MSYYRYYRPLFAESSEIPNPTYDHAKWSEHMKAYVATGSKWHYHQMLGHVTANDPPDHNDEPDGIWIRTERIGPDIWNGIKTVARCNSNLIAFIPWAIAVLLFFISVISL